MNKYISLTTLSLMFVFVITFSVFGHGEGSTLLEDVNKDGTVDIRDLVLVASSIDQQGIVMLFRILMLIGMAS